MKQIKSKEAGVTCHFNYPAFVFFSYSTGYLKLKTEGGENRRKGSALMVKYNPICLSEQIGHSTPAQQATLLSFSAAIVSRERFRFLPETHLTWN